MAIRTANIHIRIEPEIKTGAESVFSELGITASDAIAGFYDYVYRRRRLPAKLVKKSPKILNLDIATATEVKTALNDSRTHAKNGHVKSASESYAKFKQRHSL